MFVWCGLPHHWILHSTNTPSVSVDLSDYLTIGKHFVGRQYILLHSHLMASDRWGARTGSNLFEILKRVMVM